MRKIEFVLPEELKVPPLVVVEQHFDRSDLEMRIGRLPQLIKRIFKVENVYIRLINEEGNWIRTGVDGIVVEERTGENPCDFTIVAPGTVSIDDIDIDPRVKEGIIKNDVAELKSYVGHSLETGLGSRMGVLCAWGTLPRKFSAEELEMFEDISFWVERHISSSLELDRASQVQQGLLPKDDILIPGYEFAGFCRPHFSVGGDFYDWLETSEGAAFTLADVMGKGIASAIIAASVRSTIRATSQNRQAQVFLKKVVEALEPDLQRAGSFVTLIYGQLDTSAHRVSYIDAGHGLSLHVRKDGRVSKLTTSNYPIGAGPIEEWELLDIKMEPGDTLLMLSDGFLDIFEGSLERFSQLSELAVASKDAKGLVVELQKLVENAVTPDDVTALILRRW